MVFLEELHENLADDPLNDGVREEDDDKTETYVHEDGLALLHFFFVTTRGEDEETSVESVENREDPKEEHEVSNELLNCGIRGSVGTLDARLYLIGTEVDSRGSHFGRSCCESHAGEGGFFHDVHERIV